MLTAVVAGRGHLGLTEGDPIDVASALGIFPRCSWAKTRPLSTRFTFVGSCPSCRKKGTCYENRRASTLMTPCRN